nr:immunoglobulin light chain junction region [Macaca mulatta]MOW68516.1 immunoglobulin light chain junction region [Macaca mulatta]MOW69369.1 immunoglobulin light chain junction region [Macaca mulatta]MOW69677.1 immunoglobulin light chain junction region [Macaca mulatta]MOW70028.1 immunoglobulin light chain junction region [Macaca mulatta]
VYYCQTWDSGIYIF